MQEQNSELWAILWDRANKPTTVQERIEAARELIKRGVLNPRTTLPNLFTDHAFLMTLDGFYGLEGHLRSLIEPVAYGCRTI